MLALCSLGVGEIIGAFGMGYFIDKVGPKKGSFIIVVLVFLQTIIVILYILLDTYSMLAFFMTFVWGLQDSSLSIHLDAILASEFDSIKEPFSLDVLLESCSAFTFEILQSLVQTQSRRVIYMGCLGVIGIVANFLTYFFQYRNPGAHYH